MLKLKCFLQESKTIYLQSLYNMRVPIRMERPIISITFDDVPRTVITNGVPILDSFNVKATFYTAMGLSDQCTNESIESNNNREVYLSYGDILELNRCGHDISCHTYSHYMLDKGTAQGLARDAERNVRELCELLNCASIDHFSYPFGQVDFNVKKLLANNYKTMRSSRPGINQLTTDLYLLRAISIYNPTFDKKAVKQIIKKVELSGGWLIFYTHGVTHSPDAYGCTPEQLNWLIKQCKSSRAKILPVSEAYASIISSL